MASQSGIRSFSDYGSESWPQNTPMTWPAMEATVLVLVVGAWGGSNRITRKPASAKPVAKAAMKGESIGAPAPCASTSVWRASAGPSTRNEGRLIAHAYSLLIPGDEPPDLSSLHC